MNKKGTYWKNANEWHREGKSYFFCHDQEPKKSSIKLKVGEFKTFDTISNHWKEMRQKTFQYTKLILLQRKKEKKKKKSQSYQN